MSGTGAPRRGPRLTIGQVLARLADEFPSATISKIRFLEAEGLVEPERTSSGYRKFTDDDVERLRYVLRAQRDQYLPLKVIRDHLDAMDRGLEPPRMAAHAASVPDSDPQVKEQGERRVPVRLSRAELLTNAHVTEVQLRQLEEFQMISPIPGTTYFGRDALDVARAVGAFAEYGVEPRHLRVFKSAAEREVGLVEQALAPHRRRTDTEGDHQQRTAHLVEAAVRLHTALVHASSPAVQ